MRKPVDRSIDELLAAAIAQPLSALDRDKQRISFAFGNGLEEGQAVSKKSLKEAVKRQATARGLKPATR